MKGAIIGDIAGSRFEFDNLRSTEFTLLDSECYFTDDTVCTVAVAECVLAADQAHSEPTAVEFAKHIRRWCTRYPRRGYGVMFSQWLDRADRGAYHSFGNGSAMRVSPTSMAGDLESVLEAARQSAACTHDHPEGIKGAQAVADSIYSGRHSLVSKEQLRGYISEKYGYNLDFTCDRIRPVNRFDETCQVTVPQAIVAFVESTDFESAIRLAVSIGGDSDTIAAITGSIAEAYYGVPDDIWARANTFLPEPIRRVVEQFYSRYSADTYK